MTNEEAIKRLKQEYEGWENAPFVFEGIKTYIEALKLAIKALETGEVYMTGEDYNLYMEGYKAGKKDFAPKQGKWIFHKDYNESCRYGCNLCGNLNNIPSNFCPNCGAKMQKGGAE